MNKRGDSFSQFYSDHVRGVRHFVGRLLSGSSDVEDVANEAFTNTFQARQDGRNVERKAYVYVAARNAAANLRRRHMVRAEPASREDLIALAADEGVKPDEQMIARERLELLKGAFAELAPIQQDIILLRKLEGLQMGEIAERVGLSVSAVEKHIRYGLRACYAFLEAHEDEAEIDRALENEERPHRHGSA